MRSQKVGFYLLFIYAHVPPEVGKMGAFCIFRYLQKHKEYVQRRFSGGDWRIFKKQKIWWNIKTINHYNNIASYSGLNYHKTLIFYPNGDIILYVLSTSFKLINIKGDRYYVWMA